MQGQLWLFVHCTSDKSMRETQWKTFQSRHCYSLARILGIFPDQFAMTLTKPPLAGEMIIGISVFIVSSVIK